jgi:hypothetical protein
MLPDLKTGDVHRNVSRFHCLSKRVIVIAVKRAIVQAFGSLINKGIVIIGLLEIEIVLTVFPV